MTQIEETLRQLWAEPSNAAQELGGLKYYGLSLAFTGSLDFAKNFISLAQENKHLRQVFLAEEFDGKSSLAISIKNELTHKGIDVKLLDGSQPKSFGKDFPIGATAIIIDNLPSALVERDKAAKKIVTCQGSIMVLTRSLYRSERCLDGFSNRFQLPAPDTRPIDKLCRLIGLVREKVVSRFAGEDLELRTLLQWIPAQPLYKFCQLGWGQRWRSIEELADLILDRIETARLNGMSQIDPTQFFYDLVNWQQASQEALKSNAPRRLFVEGTTDRDLLLLCARLYKREPRFEWLSGLDIQVLHGTSKLNKVIREQNPHPEYDLFLLDADKDGYLAADKLKKYELAFMHLPSIFSRQPSEVNGDIEIEDLLSIQCIDQFYIEAGTRYPEAEFLYYKNGPRRRVQVAGPDKEDLVEWLAQNATLEDMERLLWLLCEIRQKLGLNLPEGLDIVGWRELLCSHSHKAAQYGVRALPWWPPLAQAK